MQRAHEAFKDKNIRVLTISIDAGGIKDVKPFLAEHRTFIVDRQGKIVASSFGPVDFDQPAFRKYVLELATKK